MSVRRDSLDNEENIDITFLAVLANLLISFLRSVLSSTKTVGFHLEHVGHQFEELVDLE